MDSAICTLFEGSYHYGVAVLINSSYNNGFRGNFFVGYKGALPSWANQGTLVNLGNWNGATVLKVKEGLSVYFLPLNTKKHLTNYKPDFMLDLFMNASTKSEILFYLDPDIVVNAPVGYLENWTTCGVAVAEDLNSPLQELHPRRVSWRKYFKDYNIDLRFKNPIYVNGGFIGITRHQIEYLQIWKDIQEKMSAAIGGLDKSIFSEKPKAQFYGDFDPFSKTDQDAMNAAVEVYNGNISFAGKEAMGFENGLITIPHALGAAKPWSISPFRLFFKGIKPRMVDKLFWNQASGPLQPFTGKKIKIMKFQLLIWSFLVRFYSK